MEISNEKTNYEKYKHCILKYREAHKDELNYKAHSYYLKRKNDEEYRIKNLERTKENYNKRQELKKLNGTIPAKKGRPSKY